MDPELMKLLNHPTFTPDYLQLERAPYHLVFDAGPLMKDISVMCSAYTVEKMSLFCWNKMNMAIPITLRQQPTGRLGGALYLMTPGQLIRLDWKRQNGVLFERKRCSVYVPSGDTGLSIIPNVWIHVGIPSVWEDKITWLDRLEYRLADRYLDNSQELNRHFRYSVERVEDFNPKSPPVSWNEAVQRYVAQKNRQQASKIRRFMQPLLSIINHKKSKVKPLPLP